MATRPTTYPKKIDIKETVYYQFKIDASTFVLFDSEMNTPIVYGSFNMVGATIVKLPKTVTIFYFEVNGREGWKMKRSYNPAKETVSEEDKKKDVERTERQKKEEV